MVTYAYRWIVLTFYSLPKKFWGSNNILSFCTLSPSVQADCLWYNIVKNLVDVHICQRFIQLDKRYFQISFVDNPISILGFCWDGWGNLRTTYLIFPKSLLRYWILWLFDLYKTKGCLAMLLDFSLERDFLAMNLLVLVSFANLIG